MTLEENGHKRFPFILSPMQKAENKTFKHWTGKTFLPNKLPPEAMQKLKKQREEKN